MTDRGLVTVLLGQWQSGDLQALDELMPVIYEELRLLARAQLNREQKNSIQCTELVAEAYLRLVDADQCDWQDRNHFFSVAARIMRRVLVDQYRKRSAKKRGQDLTLLTYQDDLLKEDATALELDVLEDALSALEQLDERQADIVTMKFFAGMNNQEIATVLDVSTKTVSRDWSVARLWLFRCMQETRI